MQEVSNIEIPEFSPCVHCGKLPKISYDVMTNSEMSCIGVIKLSSRDKPTGRLRISHTCSELITQNPHHSKGKPTKCYFVFIDNPDRCKVFWDRINIK